MNRRDNWEDDMRWMRYTCPHTFLGPKQMHATFTILYLDILVGGDLIQDAGNSLGNDGHELEVDVGVVVASRMVARVNHGVALRLPLAERLRESEA